MIIIFTINKKVLKSLSKRGKVEIMFKDIKNMKHTHDNNKRFPEAEICLTSMLKQKAEV